MFLLSPWRDCGGISRGFGLYQLSEELRDAAGSCVASLLWIFRPSRRKAVVVHP